MKKKINKVFILLAAVAIIATAICSTGIFYTILKNQIFDDLKSNAHIILSMDAAALLDSSQQISELKMNENLYQDGIRVTVIARDGIVLYDSIEDVNHMDNHRNRPEIEMALAKGEGCDIRLSVTSSRHTFYYAMVMKNGNILRIGRESASIYQLLITMVVMMIGVSLLVFAMCAFVSTRLARRLVEPVEKMADNIALIQESEVYEEMRPFVSMIKQQHMDILHSAQIRQEFTANVSHELKTPLTAISGYAELIGSGMTNGKDTVHFANEIHSSAERLQSLINDIIKLSELDNEELKLDFQELDLYQVAQNCVDTMQLQAEKNDVSMWVEGSHMTICANKTLIEELLYNLGSNAIRYNKKGGSVTILVSAVEGRPAVMVKDTGIGIPKDQQERIFERFYRVDKSRSKSTGGTGLGLAIVKHIVAQHQAQIRIYSEEEKGTEITVIF